MCLRVKFLNYVANVLNRVGNFQNVSYNSYPIFIPTAIKPFMVFSLFTNVCSIAVFSQRPNWHYDLLEMVLFYMSSITNKIEQIFHENRSVELNQN